MWERCVWDKWNRVKIKRRLKLIYLVVLIQRDNIFLKNFCRRRQGCGRNRKITYKEKLELIDRNKKLKYPKIQSKFEESSRVNRIKLRKMWVGYLIKMKWLKKAKMLSRKNPKGKGKMLQIKWKMLQIKWKMLQIKWKNALGVWNR